MGTAIILHGTEGHSKIHWLPWLKTELEKLGRKVWVPDLPGADHPNIKRYNNFLLGQEWDFQDNLIIGHSSGAVEILGLLQSLPNGVTIDTAVLVGSFSQVLAEEPKWQQLKGLFEEPFDFDLIKTKARQFIFVHGDDDPWCPVDQAEFLCKKLGGEMNLIHGGQHFSTQNNPKWQEFPELLEIIKQKVKF